MALTVERKNMILEKLRVMPEGEVRVINPADTDQRDAIKYILDNNELPAHDIVINSTWSKIKKVPLYPRMGEYVGIGLPDIFTNPPHQRKKVFSMNVRPATI